VTPFVVGMEYIRLTDCYEDGRSAVGTTENHPFQFFGARKGNILAVV